MTTQKEWTHSGIDSAKAKYVGLIEFQSEDGEFHNFEIIASKTRVAFGGACNVGFIESGWIDREDGESLDETLAEMLADLACYYNNGPEYVSRVVCSERM
jgi:hypothetical protein